MHSALMHDAGVALLPLEHLSPAGMSPELARWLRGERAWEARKIALFDRGFALYWSRSRDLCQSDPHWIPPRSRNVVVAEEPNRVRPYVALLNTSAWLLDASDLTPDASHPEFIAYLLAHADRVAESGEVTHAVLTTAAWWFERTDVECEAFAAAARASTRPDASGFAAMADALPWLRELHHERLRPMEDGAARRTIPQSGLEVPLRLENRPPQLVGAFETAAHRAVEAFLAPWRGRNTSALENLCSWLRDGIPKVALYEGDRQVWNCETPEDLAGVRSALASADAVSVRSIASDLARMEHHTRLFCAAVRGDLPDPPHRGEQGGYCFLDAHANVLAYNLRESGMDRYHGPALPFAREMLGARAAHEWAHLADAAGWIRSERSDREFERSQRVLAEQLDAVIDAAVPPVRSANDGDGVTTTGEASAGILLTKILLQRLPDYRANRLARYFMSPAEREAYLRHNIRSLRGAYDKRGVWRMLVRYLYEFQYLQPALGLLELDDPRAYFLASTGFDREFIESGILTGEAFDALSEATADLLTGFQIDPLRIQLPHDPASDVAAR